MILYVIDRHMHMIPMRSPKGWNMTKCATAPPAKTYFGNQQARLLWLPASFSYIMQQSQSNLLCSGLYGKSTVREVDMLTGNVIRQQALPARDFGEGLAKFGNRWVILLHVHAAGH